MSLHPDLIDAFAIITDDELRLVLVRHKDTQFARQTGSFATQLDDSAKEKKLDLIDKIKTLIREHQPRSINKIRSITEAVYKKRLTDALIEEFKVFSDDDLRFILAKTKGTGLSDSEIIRKRDLIKRSVRIVKKYFPAEPVRTIIESVLVAREKVRDEEQPGQRAVQPPGQRAVHPPGQRAAQPPGQRAVQQPGQRAIQQPGQRAAQPPGERYEWIVEKKEQLEKIHNVDVELKREQLEIDVELVPSLDLFRIQTPFIVTFKYKKGDSPVIDEVRLTYHPVIRILLSKPDQTLDLDKLGLGKEDQNDESKIVDRVSYAVEEMEGALYEELISKTLTLSGPDINIAGEVPVARETDQLIDRIKTFIPNLASLYNHSSGVPVLVERLLRLSLQNGFPQAPTKTLEHRKMLRQIILKGKPEHVHTLVKDGFTACQAVQIRVLESFFSGKDPLSQVKKVVQTQKNVLVTRLLVQVVGKGSDAILKDGAAPHYENAVKLVLNDRSKKPLIVIPGSDIEGDRIAKETLAKWDRGTREEIRTRFLEIWSQVVIEELLPGLIHPINNFDPTKASFAQKDEIIPWEGLITSTFDDKDRYALLDEETYRWKIDKIVMAYLILQLI